MTKGVLTGVPRSDPYEAGLFTDEEKYLRNACRKLAGRISITRLIEFLEEELEYWRGYVNEQA